MPQGGAGREVSQIGKDPPDVAVCAAGTLSNFVSRDPPQSSHCGDSLPRTRISIFFSQSAQ